LHYLDKNHKLEPTFEIPDWKSSRGYYSQFDGKCHVMLTDNESVHVSNKIMTSKECQSIVDPHLTIHTPQRMHTFNINNEHAKEGFGNPDIENNKMIQLIFILGLLIVCCLIYRHNKSV
jgi:hypothetical protein